MRGALRQGHEQVAAERHAWPAFVCATRAHLTHCAPSTTPRGITRQWRAEAEAEAVRGVRCSA